MKIESHLQLTEKLRAEIADLYPKIFESFNKEKFFKKITLYNQLLFLSAYENEQLVGFKFGHAMDPDLFYSWTGGVHPDHRRKGIATELMKAQHDWCKKNGFKRIETRTRNKFPEMISLNLKSGFQIMGTFTDTDKTPKIILRKELL